MKGLSFWQWLGLVILISVIGTVLFNLMYGRKLLDTAAKINETATDQQ